MRRKYVVRTHELGGFGVHYADRDGRAAGDVISGHATLEEAWAAIDRYHEADRRRERRA